MESKEKRIAYFHLPGLFEFYDLYKVFLPLFYGHIEYFSDWCDIGSIYGAPADCLWNGGRVGFGENDPKEVLGINAEIWHFIAADFRQFLASERTPFRQKFNELRALFVNNGKTENEIIIYSDLLLEYIRKHSPGFCFVSSTTKICRTKPGEIPLCCP